MWINVISWASKVQNLDSAQSETDKYLQQNYSPSKREQKMSQGFKYHFSIQVFVQ